MLRGQLVGARADLDLAVSLWPQGPLPLLFRAVVKQKLGLLEAASSDFRAAVPLLQADFRTVDAERRRLEHAPSRAPAELVALAAVARNQPDGPSMAKNSPRPIVKSASSTAVNEPYCLRTWSR
jgi:hypothetical protein